MAFCQRGCNWVCQPPLSYGEWGFTAMAVNRAVSSHHFLNSGRFETNGRECEAAVESVQQDSGLKLRIMAIVRTLTVIAAAVAGNASSR